MCAPPAVPWQCLGVRLQQRTAPFERAQRSVLHVGAVHPCQLSASGAWDGLPLALARGSKLGEGHRKTCTGPALRIRSKSVYKPVELNVTLRGRQIDGSKISAKMPYLMPYLGAFFKYDSTGLSVQGNYVDAQWYPSTGF